MAAGTSGEFRRISNASGPQASAGQYVSTQDIGKQVAAGTGGEYRRIVTATGIYFFLHSSFAFLHTNSKWHSKDPKLQLASTEPPLTLASRLPAPLLVLLLISSLALLVVC